jgi:hypothetical protein
MFFVRPGLKTWQKPSGIAGTEIKILSTMLLHYTREMHIFLRGRTWKLRTALMSDGRNRREMSNWEVKGGIEERNAGDDELVFHCD